MRLHPRYTSEILPASRRSRRSPRRPPRTTSAWTARLPPRRARRRPLAARRALAVADVFEALTADRPYRAPMAPEAALEIMRRDVGEALCPRAFGALESALAGPRLALAA